MMPASRRGQEGLAAIDQAVRGRLRAVQARLSRHACPGASWSSRSLQYLLLALSHTRQLAHPDKVVRTIVAVPE